MKKLIPLVVVLISSQLNAQSTLIEYDYQTEEYTFYKIDKKGKKTKTKRPFSYKGIPTKVVVKNMNTFYYDVAFKAESQTETPINGDQSVEMLAENFTTGYSAFSDMVGDVKSSDIYKTLFADGKFQGLAGIKELATGTGYGAQEFQDKWQGLEGKGRTLESTQKKITGTTKDLTSTFKNLLLMEFVEDQLIKLQTNKNISPVEMKKRADSLVKIIIPQKSLNEVVDKSMSYASALSENYNDYRTGYTLYEIQQKDLQKFIDQFKAELSPDDDDYLAMITEFEAEAQADYDEITNHLDALNSLVENYSEAEIRDHMLRIYESYDVIMNADFDFEYSLNTDEDVTRLTMDFFQSQQAANDSIDSEPQVVKSRVIDVPTKGGLRINSSAGISFLRYVNGHESYSSEGGTVRSIEGDAFIPALTTMFHFYGQSPSPVSFGGSFGFAIPTEGDKDFIYMLGGSTIFGKSQRVILNVGAFGGKIERLDGLKVGDSISDGSIVPTKKVFDFGMYAGITLNINKLF